jgi:hypothetical protein
MVVGDSMVVGDPVVGDPVVGDRWWPATPAAS